jgi:hypothetical protein
MSISTDLEVPRMSLEIEPVRSRRAVLAAALGAGAAVAASAISRPLPVNAADGDNALLGQANTATSTTSISVGVNAGPAVHGIAATIGVKGTGDTAIWGESAGTNGVWGHSTGATGYTGGVSGQSDSTDGVGIWGISAANGAGAMGISTADGIDPFSGAPSKVGVFGYAAQDTSAVGVKGQSTAGVGVLAAATTGAALQVSGKAKFSRSGRANVPANKKYVDVTVAGGLAANTVVHATLQTYRSGVAVAAVRKNYPSTGKARIYLTKVASTTSATAVGWFAAEY